MNTIIKPQTLKGFRDFLPIIIKKTDRVGVFIDEANVFYAQKELGWKIDWKKFADLMRTEFNLKMLRYYLGMPLAGQQKINNLKVKTFLESFGYTVITKPLKKIYIDNIKSEFKYKCNFDVEISLDVVSFIKNLDVVILVSNDSDFLALRDFSLINKKKFLFICFERRIAWEIRRSKFLFMEKLKKLIEFQQKKTSTKSRGGVTKS